MIMLLALDHVVVPDPCEYVTIETMPVSCYYEKSHQHLLTIRPDSPRFNLKEKVRGRVSFALTVILPRRESGWAWGIRVRSPLGCCQSGWQAHQAVWCRSSDFQRTTALQSAHSTASSTHHPLSSSGHFYIHVIHLISMLVTDTVKSIFRVRTCVCVCISIFLYCLNRKKDIDLSNKLTCLCINLFLICTKKRLSGWLFRCNSKTSEVSSLNQRCVDMPKALIIPQKQVCWAPLNRLSRSFLYIWWANSKQSRRAGLGWAKWKAAIDSLSCIVISLVFTHMALEPGKLNREKNKYGLYCAGNERRAERGGGMWGLFKKKKKKKSESHLGGYVSLCWKINR